MRMIRLMYVAPENDTEEDGCFSLRTDGLSSQKYVALTMIHLIGCVWHTLDEEGRKMLEEEALSEELVKFLTENEKDLEEEEDLEEKEKEDD